MTDKDRSISLCGINEGKSFREIAEEIGKSQTTVSREILKHRYPERKGAKGRACNDCKKRLNCPVAHICNDVHCRKHSCSGCSKVCGPGCPQYEKHACPLLSKPPYVCTPLCGKRQDCILEKMRYSPPIAQHEYSKMLSESRQVLHTTEEEIAMMESTISQGLKKGQSLNHIYSYAGQHMPVSLRTAYNYINDGVFQDVIRLDQPKAVRMRQRRRKASTESQKADSSRLTGRTYADYLVFMEGNPGTPVVEMDCVEGPKKGSGRVLLTFLFNPSGLQIAFILEKHDSAHVVECFDMLWQRLGSDLYKELFPVILTDRGKEFNDADGIEMREGGELVSQLFYCNPESPGQKGRCERNHAELRRILPKGTDITVSQDKIDLMMNHINSMARPAFANKSAYDMFVFLYGQEAADALGLAKIPRQNVTQTPALLK